jgi:hypothetical protein
MKENNTSSTKDMVNTLLDLAPHTEIAHHVPGSIKLRLLFSGLPIFNEIDFEALTKAVPGILDTRVRLLARTVLIEYDPDRLPYDLWELMGALKDDPGLAENLRARLDEALGHGQAT